MEHPDFSIDATFWCDDRQWHCTEIGTRTVTAIHIDSVAVASTEPGCAGCSAAPRPIRVDQGSEFVSRDLDLWAYANNVTLDFSRPGKPTDNAFIEAFNGRFRA